MGLPKNALRQKASSLRSQIDQESQRLVGTKETGLNASIAEFEGAMMEKEFAEPWQDAATVADGLRVPAAVGDFLIMRALRESNGTAIAVSGTVALKAAWSAEAE